ncbi:NUDIX domain-containing protein [Microbacterium sp. A196]|uniref:NUDIX domain-containing protein n=1 Tax=Microbacterium sp. A196 TaxID=3457320 RepID=UPI003FD196B0
MSAHSFAVVPAAYVYLRRGGDVLLQFRQNTGYMDGTWAAAAAGHIELGETAAAAGAREAAEELSITIPQAALTPLTVMQRTDGTTAAIEQRVDWFFTASSWSGTPRIMEPAKCADIAWFPLRGLPDAMPAYERVVLDALAQSTLQPFTSYGF